MNDTVDIERIAVLGAGTMGHGIAQVAAMAGYEVTLRDISEELVGEGIEQIEWSLGKLDEKGQISTAEADQARDRIEGHVDLETAVEDADLVVESVPENIEIKQAVYEDLDKATTEDTILASNTSTLSITQLGGVTNRPGQVCGMHFFNPPVRMPLVEVIAGEHTAESTLETVRNVAESMDKTPIDVRKDTPGFIVNRVLIPMLNEAAWLVETGDTTMEAIDATTSVDLDLPMGAFQLSDQIGIDVIHEILEYMASELGPTYRPAPAFERQVAANELGRKTDKGFYDYTNGGPPSIDPDAGAKSIKQRLVAVMCNQVAALVENDVASREEIDRALELGAGFPRGPSVMGAEIGYQAVIDALEKDGLGTDDKPTRERPTYEPTAVLRGWATVPLSQSTDTDPSTFQTIQLTEPEQGVAHVVLDREQQLNTVTTTMLNELETVIDMLNSRPEIRSMVLSGAGDRAFCTGANLTDLAAVDNRFEGAEIATRGKTVFRRLADSSMPVVAAVDGLCLGGGMELASFTDLCVASKQATFGQPEHNLGIMPGWGGTQRLREIVGDRRAREIIMTGDHYEASTMAEYGFVTELSDEPVNRAIELASKLASGPPLAQALTKQAMQTGLSDTTAGYELESAAFGSLLETADAAEGFEAFFEDRDPEFSGQ